MARIPAEEIERLKREVSLARVVEGYGVTLRPHGADLHGLCPFHEDKEPSFVVSPEKNLWHCLGACRAGGSVIDFVMRAEGVSFRHAVELLRQDLPSSAAVAHGVKRSTVRKMAAPFEPDAEDEELLKQVVAYYHETLKQSPEALDYLASRGLKQAEAIAHFKLGFSNRSLGYRLPEKNRKAGAEMRGRLQKLGILRPSGHEHFNGSLLIPILDENGRVLELYGRKVTAGLRQGTPLHLYLPGPHRGVWNSEALGAYEEVILCEALIDALTFWCAGFRNVTSSYGVEGFTREHLEAFKRHRTKRVLIAYDRDEAGERAAASLAERLMDEGLECFRIQFPRGMDANAYALKVQPAARSLELVIRQAAWLGKGRAPERSLPAMVLEEPAPLADIEPAAPAEEPPASEAPTADVSPLAAEPSEPVIEPAPLSAAPPANTPERTVEEPQASPVPAPKPRAVGVEAEAVGEEIRIQLGDRRWRVRGLGKNLSFEQLKVNLLVSRSETERRGSSGQGFFVDTLDLYSARQRGLFVGQAAEELGVEPGVIKRDLGSVLLKLEELQEQAIEKALAPKDERPQLSEAERAQGMALLEDKQLLERILQDFERCGVVGEETNKLVGYLAAVSRKLEEPLAVVIQSSSAAGKTSLMEAVLDFFPDEERVKYSAMTGQSLFYMGEKDLSHKILAIVEEEGAERASYALKLLQSERELSIASTGKDPSTGRLVTHEYKVEGPVMIFLTTTAVEIDDELENRCIVLSVDEEREQTRAIHRSQRQKQTLEGLLARREREQVLAAHRNAQRLLRPLLVANPFAEQLTFVDGRTRTRRDHMKYLTLIRTIALLHQYQRPLRTTLHRGERVAYVEVTLEDIEVANRLAHQVFGHSQGELAPQTRRLLEGLGELVSRECERLRMDRSDYRFSRREVREQLGWGQTQLRVHLERLVELEYVLVHRGGRGQQFVYELVFDGKGKDGAHLSGLVDVGALRSGRPAATTETWRGQKGDLAGGWRGHGGPKAGGWRGAEAGQSAKPLAAIGSEDRSAEENARPGRRGNGRSYTLGRRRSLGELPARGEAH